MSKFTSFFIALFTAIFLALFFTFPAVRFLDTYLIGDGADNYEFAGFNTLVAQNLREGKLPFSASHFWYYPDGFEFSRGYDGALPALIGGSLILFLKNPVLAYNLTILLAMVCNYLFSYLLFSYLSKDRFIATLGAIAFGFSFYVLARGAGHANLIWVGGFPLLMYSLLRIQKNQSFFDLSLVFISILFLAMSSLQYLLLLISASLVILLVLFVFYRKELFSYGKVIQKHQGTLLILMISLGFILIPLISPFIKSLLKQDYVGHDRAANYSPHPIDIVLPDKFYPSLLSTLSPIAEADKHIEHAVALGVIEVIFVLVLAALYFKKKYVAPLLIITGVFILMALGSSHPTTGAIMPYYFLKQLPPFSLISEPGRFNMLANLFLITTLVLLLKEVQSRQKQIGFMILFGVLLLGERASTRGYFISKTPDMAYAQVVAEADGNGVLDIPLYEVNQNIFPFYYQKGVVSGYTHWLANTQQLYGFLEENIVLGNYICSPVAQVPSQYIAKQRSQLRGNALENLKANQIETIVLHKDNQLYWPQCNFILQSVSQEFPRYSTATRSSLRATEDHLRWAGISMDVGIYFDRAGEFSLKGFEIAPSNVDPSISLGEVPIDLSGSQMKKTLRDDGRQMLSVTFPEELQKDFSVKAGEKLSFLSDEVPELDGYITIWYTFTPDATSKIVPFTTQEYQRTYFDRNTEVYTIF